GLDSLFVELSRDKLAVRGDAA
ncbi:MAG: hypothetical protein JWR39_2410, partial [Devosia sp.]|nr:hypothetical protein [Devosia sp.]